MLISNRDCPQFQSKFYPLPEGSLALIVLPSFSILSQVGTHLRGYVRFRAAHRVCMRFTIIASALPFVQDCVSPQCCVQEYFSKDFLCVCVCTFQPRILFPRKQDKMPMLLGNFKTAQTNVSIFVG